MDWRSVGDDRRRHVPPALTGARPAPLGHEPRAATAGRTGFTPPRHARPQNAASLASFNARRIGKGLAHLNASTPERRLPMKCPNTTARQHPEGRPRRLPDPPYGTACRARVYPMPGPFLNPVAFSNIESYPMTCGWSGTAPRSLLLRSSSGTLVTMQPPMKSAQSILARLLPAGTRARAAR